MKKTIYLGFDHGAFQVRGFVRRYLGEKQVAYKDFSKEKLDPSDDYPDAVVPAAKAAAKDGSFAIVGCSSGTGSSIAANKLKGIRAAPLHDETLVYLARLHNDLNCLALRGMIFSSDIQMQTAGSYINLLSIKHTSVTEQEVRKLVKVFLETEFEGGRHQKRIEKIE